LAQGNCRSVVTWWPLCKSQQRRCAGDEVSRRDDGGRRQRGNLATGGARSC